MAEKNNILSAASQSLLLVELNGIGGWNSHARLKDASTILAEKYGGSEKAFKGSENMLPPPHDEEYKELKSAFGAYRSAFYAMTMPYGSATSHTGKVKAEGKRAVLASKIVDGSFTTTMSALGRTLDAAREKFAMSLPARVAAIRSESSLGTQFDEGRYPSPEEVRRGWYYEEIIPEPILDARLVQNMGLPPEVAKMIEENLARKVEAQVQFGQQQLVNETVDYIKVMVTNLTKLNAWFGNSEGKRPAIFDSLIDNVTESLDKLRSYALPGTNEGDALIALVDRISSQLQLDELDLKDLKNDHKKAGQVLAGAKAASTMLDAWQGTSTVFDEPEPTTPEPAPEPIAPVTEEAKEESLDDLLSDFDEEPTPEPEPEPEPTPEPELTTAQETALSDDLDDLLAGW